MFNHLFCILYTDKNSKIRTVNNEDGSISLYFSFSTAEKHAKIEEEKDINIAKEEGRTPYKYVIHQINIDTSMFV